MNGVLPKVYLLKTSSILGKNGTLNDEKHQEEEEEEKEQVGRSGAGTDRSWQAVPARLAGGLWLISMEITVVSWQISHLTRCHRNTFYFRLTLREMIRRRRRTAFFKKRKKQISSLNFSKLLLAFSYCIATIIVCQ